MTDKETFGDYWEVRNHLVMKWNDYRSANITGDAEQIANTRADMLLAMDAYEKYCTTRHSVIADMYKIT
jgi:hypothetical protein